MATELPDRASTEGLHGHLDAAYEAADKLVREASERARASDAAHREGRSRSTDDGVTPEPPSAALAELKIVHTLLDTIRRSLPAEFTEALAQHLRRLLAAVRDLLDWCLERIAERGR